MLQTTLTAKVQHFQYGCMEMHQVRGAHIPCLPSSSVLVTTCCEDGPVPALFAACTTTLYWVNFFRLSSTMLSVVSPVLSTLIMVNWWLPPGLYSLQPTWQPRITPFCRCFCGGCEENQEAQTYSDSSYWVILKYFMANCVLYLK